MTAPTESGSAHPPDQAARRPAAASASSTPGARIRRAAAWGFAGALGWLVPALADAFWNDFFSASYVLGCACDAALAAAFAWWTLSGRRAEGFVGVIGLVSVILWISSLVLSVPLGASGFFSVYHCWGLGFALLFAALITRIPLLIRASAVLAALSFLPQIWLPFRILSGRLLASRGDPLFSESESLFPFREGFWLLSSLLFFIAFVRRARVGAPTPEEAAEDAARDEARRAAREEALRHRREANERALREAAAANAAALAANQAAAAALRQAAAAAAARPPAVMLPPGAVPPPGWVPVRYPAPAPGAPVLPPGAAPPPGWIPARYPTPTPGAPVLPPGAVPPPGWVPMRCPVPPPGAPVVTPGAPVRPSGAGPLPRCIPVPPPPQTPPPLGPAPSPHPPFVPQPTKHPQT